MFAVLTVDAPKERFNNKWSSFMATVQTQEKDGQSKNRPADNVWLLSLPEDTTLLALVVHNASQYQLQHRVLYFTEPPLVFSNKPTEIGE